MRATSRAVQTVYRNLAILKSSSMSVMAALGRGIQGKVKLKELTDIYQK